MESPKRIASLQDFSAQRTAFPLSPVVSAVSAAFSYASKIVGKSMKYRCQSCNYELPDIWKWKIVDRSKYLMVVTCPHCNNEFIRMEYDPDTPYGYRVIPSTIFVPQGIKRRNRIIR
jgi:C4-type Zn-finger protein